MKKKIRPFAKRTLAKASAPAAARVPQMFIPVQYVAQPGGAVLVKPGKPVVLHDDEIGTAEAACMAGLSQRRIESICEEGVLRENIDWTRPGGPRGCYKIKRASLLRLRYGTNWLEILEKIAQQRKETN